VGLLHSGPSGKRDVFLARTTAEYDGRTSFESIRFFLMPTGRADKAVRPSQSFEVCPTSRVAREDLLELGERRGESRRFHGARILEKSGFVNKPGKHAIIPRLKKVVNGEDQGGVTQSVGWKGGGGFRYFRLAPSLLEIDKWGREVISKAYNAAMLAEALCKIEGFIYAPSDSVYWQQGHSTERDFIYVTTQTLSQEHLQHLSEEVGLEHSLLVLCSAFRGNALAFPNLTVKKIPNHIRSRCEWGRDDYSLNVNSLPKLPTINSSSAHQQELFDDVKAIMV
jgi:hypothetical protein